ncbi:hypothetical protein [Anatilimnocola floriformis]|uniref:hypothetical protein n=1 Tax=Anatilimnocola floriformis TaxID=2948575 RepID=UPI0020C3D97E|nr:hypothetical protein [Anatilimnocola floriformis]
MLQDASSKESKRFGGSIVLVANSKWVGKKPPAIDDPTLREILLLTHHRMNGRPSMSWVHGKPPASLQLIGVIPPSASEIKLLCNTYAHWDYITGQPWMQWRLDHDHAAVLKEDAAEEVAEERERQKADSTRQAYLKKVTLDDLANHEFFSSWKRLPGRRLTKLSRALMANAVRRLTELGARSKKQDRLEVLRDCIEAFNHLDSHNNHFIETEEREAICLELEAICHACGMQNKFEEVLEQRDW